MYHFPSDYFRASRPERVLLHWWYHCSIFSQIISAPLSFRGCSPLINTPLLTDPGFRWILLAIPRHDPRLWQDLMCIYQPPKSWGAFINLNPCPARSVYMQSQTCLKQNKETLKILRKIVTNAPFNKYFNLRLSIFHLSILDMSIFHIHFSLVYGKEWCSPVTMITKYCKQGK